MQQDHIVFPPASAHPDIILAHSGVPGDLLDWLKKYFLAAVESGHRFADDESIQIGWMMLKVRKHTDGNLILWEPDFAALPIVWTLGVDRTVHQMSLQQAVCDALKTAPVYPILRDGAVVSPGFPESADSFMMMRGAPGENSSGWQFKKLQDTAKEGARQSLYEIALRANGIVPFLALPPGAVIARTKDVIEVELGETHLTSKTHPLLASFVGG